MRFHTASAESSRSLTVNMQQRAYDRFWPKADIETESKWVFLNGCFGEKSGRSPMSTDTYVDPSHTADRVHHAGYLYRLQRV